jgi:hypothetical protein
MTNDNIVLILGIARPVNSAVKQELITRFLGRGLVGQKDPRFVALFPLSLDVLNDLNLPITLITTSRADGEVRRSIA